MSTAIAEKTIEDFRFTDDELDKVKKDAYISDCEDYRYYLTRVWDEDLPRVMYVLLNPSTADHTVDDQTVRKCMGFAKGWEHGSIEIVNLFAYRTKNPKVLKSVIDKKGEAFAIGPKNDEYIKAAAERADLIVLGWGNNAKDFEQRRAEVLEILKEKEVKCLDITIQEQPKHPLYIKFLDIPDETFLKNYPI